MAFLGSGLNVTDENEKFNFHSEYDPWQKNVSLSLLFSVQYAKSVARRQLFDDLIEMILTELKQLITQHRLNFDINQFEMDLWSITFEEMMQRVKPLDTWNRY